MKRPRGRDPERYYRGAAAPDRVGPRHVALCEHGTERPLRQRQDVYNHSPDGFSWGYGGSGPAQLALAILCDAIGPAEAVRFHQEFKRARIATLEPDKPWTMPVGDVLGWWVLASLRETARQRSEGST